MRAVAQRYAGALADVVIAQSEAEKVKKELAAFVALVEESADLRNLLVTPAVTPEQKHAVIEKLLARLGAGKTLKNFLFVLVDNRRAGLLAQIQPAFEEELLARQGIAEAQVTSARELTAAEKQELTVALAKLTGKRVEAKYALDTELIGGAVARIGSTIYDGSVREQLRRLQTKLATE